MYPQGEIHHSFSENVCFVFSSQCKSEARTHAACFGIPDLGSVLHNHAEYLARRDQIWFTLN